jgi:hypothetical protein
MEDQGPSHLLISRRYLARPRFPSSEPNTCASGGPRSGTNISTGEHCSRRVDLPPCLVPRQSCQPAVEPCPRRAGRPPGWPGHRSLRTRGWAGCGIPPTSRGLPHGIPGAEPDDPCAGGVEGCPRDTAWSGCARLTGCHTTPRARSSMTRAARHRHSVAGTACSQDQAVRRPSDVGL